MKTNINHVAASASSLHDNLCFDIDPAVTTLNVFADDEHSYQLPYAQFMYAEWTCNPALEREPDAPSEKLLIRFVKAEVVVLGSGLKSLMRAIQKYELKFVKSADQRYVAASNTHVASVAVTFTKENS